MKKLLLVAMFFFCATVVQANKYTVLVVIPDSGIAVDNDAIGREIYRTKADIVFISDSFIGRAGRSMDYPLGRLASMTGKHPFFTPTAVSPAGDRGFGLLSRYSFHSTKMLKDRSGKTIAQEIMMRTVEEDSLKVLCGIDRIVPVPAVDHPVLMIGVTDDSPQVELLNPPGKKAGQVREHGIKQGEGYRIKRYTVKIY